MSIENVELFIADVKTNDALEKKLNDALGVAAVVEVANTQGYKITEADMRAYIGRYNAELSEKELDSVAGGLAWGREDKFP